MINPFNASIIKHDLDADNSVTKFYNEFKAGLCKIVLQYYVLQYYCVAVLLMKRKSSMEELSRDLKT